ncbi:hypothetical protein [Massilia sp.]|uniref:hypothetical protein n=1 Tax=Massilia sp. TaxID=1882437 RepID=UPI0028A2B878|nr:hypothetical protein [Massilia sp.]
MASNQNKSAPRPGNQGGTHEQHVQAGRQSHKNDASRQSDSLSNQQSGSRSGQSQQSGSQSESNLRSGQSQQSGSRSGQSQQSGSRSGAGVQGGTPEQHAAAGRQSHKNDKNR